MQVKFYIDNAGRIFTSGRGKAKPARNYPVELSRSGHQINVRLDTRVSEQALLSLMNYSRSMKRFEFLLISNLPGVASRRFESLEPFCLAIGLSCLSLFEKGVKGRFKSQITLWDKTELDRESLPEKLTQNAALYRFNAERQLVQIKLPKPLMPRKSERVTQPELEDISDEVYIRWLAMCGHTTLAVGTPLCQQGQLDWHLAKEDGPKTHKFIRLLYPLTSPYERPNNYRLITITYLPDSKTFIL